MRRLTLIRRMNQAIAYKHDICAAILIPGQDEYEYIINKNASLENKLKYYLDTYVEKDGKLVHSKNEAIEMVDIFSIDFYVGE